MSRFIGVRCPMCKRTGCCDTIVYMTTRFCYQCKDNSEGKCDVTAPENKFNGFVNDELCPGCMKRIMKMKEDGTWNVKV